MRKGQWKYWIAFGIIILLFLFLCAFILFLSWCYMKDYSNGNPKKDDITETFEHDFKDLEKVAVYLVSLDEYAYLTIRDASGTMVLQYGDQEKIQDEEICQLIASLFHEGYTRIFKNQTNTICFERWRNSFGRLSGFALSVDGSGRVIVDYLTEQEPMSKENWYYYVGDYEEWRVNRKHTSPAKDSGDTHKGQLFLT